jgi:hypothetical protein
VRRRDEHGAGAGRGEGRDVEAVLVDRDAHGLEARPLERPAVQVEARILDGDPPLAASRSSRAIRTTPCVTPLQTTVRSGSGATARARPR